MRKVLILAVVAAAIGGVVYYRSAGRAGTAQGVPGGGFEGGRRGGGFGGGGFPGGFRGGGRGPLTVELTKAYRTSLADEVMVVGNLIGDATVSVVPRTAGRLQDIYVRLGDRVTRGQRLAKIEDFEFVEQVKQAEAAAEVALATIRQRDADLKLAQTNVERSRNLFERQLLPKQTLDDNEARYLAAIAQVDLARAQNTQSRARLDELRINLSNTTIVSPVNGFVSRRDVDPGAFVSQNAPVVDVVDITQVRLVANVVERDLKQMQAGNTTRVQVDAYPGETFTGRIARVSPVLDPSTRTAPIEIEIPNPTFRLKPGMYARVGITTGTNKEAVVLPSSAVVDLGGRRGIFRLQNDTAIFQTVQVGTERGNLVEIIGGVNEGDEVISTGAGSLRDGDRVALVGTPASGPSGGRRGGQANAPADAAPAQPAGGTGAGRSGGGGETEGSARGAGAESQGNRYGGGRRGTGAQPPAGGVSQ